MGQYANNTTVSPEKSQSDIRETLRRYGAGSSLERRVRYDVQV